MFNNESPTKISPNLIGFIIAFSVFIWSFSAGIVTIALPTISQYMDINTTLVSWVVVAHLLVLTSFLLIFGKIGDYVGYKNIYMGGLFLFTVGSYLSGISLNITTLIASRILQGVGSAMLLSMTPAIISKVFPHSTRGKIFGFISLATTMGLSLGYGVGGIVTEYMGWHWIFFITVPLGALATILTYFYLPEIKPSMEYHGFDLVGSILIFLAVILLIMPIEMGSKLGWTSPLILGALISSGVIFLIFYKWEHNYKNPLLHICLLKQKQLNISIIAGFMSSFVLTGTIFLLPFYFELILNYDTDVAGIIILLSTLLIIVVGPLSGRLADKIGSRLPAILGAVLLAATMTILTLIDPTVGEFGVILIVLALIMRSVADGIFSPANNKLVMSHSPAKMVGSVSSLLNTAKYLGLVLGVVIFETIFDSTISHSAGHMEGVTGTGAFQYSVPIETLLTGFHHAFLIGALICILIVAASFLAKENSNVTDEIEMKKIEENIIEPDS
ncbi:MAG: MFS transporter [Methanobacterium sp. ERen5]|nr:MAG: MFS transporter [Methanobacterium sp. ERen5]